MVYAHGMKLKNSLYCALVAALICFQGCSDDTSAKQDASVDGASSDAGTTSGPLTIDELINACIRATSCRMLPYPKVHSCVDNYFDLLQVQNVSAVWNKLYRCVNLAKGDCGAIEKCYDYRGSCDNSYKASCSGTTAITCDLISGRAYALDCAAAKMDCAVKKNYPSQAVCTPGTCVSSMGNVCNGTVLINCVSGISEAYNCGLFGMTCEMNNFVKGCRGEKTNTNCSPKKFSASCSSNTAVTCVGNQEHHEDCTKKINRKTKCSGGACVEAGTECSGNMNRCKGKLLEACLNGKWKTFDCEKLGLDPCINKGTYAICEPPDL